MDGHATNTRLTDDEFIARYEAQALADFSHEDHVRMAFVYARRGGPDAAVAGARRIRGFAAALGAPEKYHETITVAWARVVAHLAQRDDKSDFGDFLAAHPGLHDRRLLAAHYSDELLFSPAARRDFVEPDLMALP